MTLRSRGTRAAVLLACFAAFSPLPALGQELAMSMPTYVVTATRTPTDINRVGSSISVITENDIDNQQTRFIADILQTTPGLSFSQTGARGTVSSLKLRGQNPEGTLVLIDGIEVSDPSVIQPSFDFTHLLAGGIERIEILRGSQSVLYGGDAVGGVINIISKRGAGPFSGALYGEGGSFDTYLVGGRVLGASRGDRAGYNVDVQYLDTNGFSAADENLPGNTEAEAYHNFSSKGRFDVGVTEQADVRAVYRIAKGTRNFDACGGAFCDDPDVYDDFLEYSGRVSSAIRLFDDAFTGNVGAAYSRTERNGFDNGAESNFFIGDRIKFDFQGAYTIDANNQLVFGAETKDDRMRTDSNRERISARNSGFYGLYQLTLFESLHLSAGGRIDKHETFGSFKTYRVTAAYEIPTTGTRVKGSYSTGFRAPSLFELYGRCCGDPLFGNTALGPEESKSWDAGLEQRLFDDSLHLEAVYFQIETDNKIEFGGAFGTPAPNYFNVSGVTRSKGVETRLVWQPVEALEFTVAYTYNEVKTTSGQRLENRPKNVLNGNVNYAFWQGRANLNLNARHHADTVDTAFDPITFAATRVKLDNAVVVSLAARVNVLENTEVTGRIENLLDDEYQTEFGYGTAGRSFYVGLKQKI